MKIVIKSSEGKNIKLVLPTRLMLNGCTASLSAWLINRTATEEAGIIIDAKSLRLLMKEINRMKKKYPDLLLVDVESKDGEKIQITL